MLVGDYLETLPKKVRKQAAERGGEYYTLFFLLNDITYELVFDCIPLIGTSYMKRIPTLMGKEVLGLAKKYKVPEELVRSAIAGSLSQLALMNNIVEKTGFEKWYDAECSASMSRAERRKKIKTRDQVFFRRPLEMKKGATETDFVEAIKEDLRSRGNTDEEISKMFTNGQIGAYLDGKIVEIDKNGSYNEDKKKK